MLHIMSDKNLCRIHTKEKVLILYLCICSIKRYSVNIFVHYIFSLLIIPNKKFEFSGDNIDDEEKMPCVAIPITGHHKASLS